MKKVILNFLVAIGVVGAIAIVALTVRYGAVSTARGDAELYRWRLEHAVRP